MAFGFQQPRGSESRCKISVEIQFEAAPPDHTADSPWPLIGLWQPQRVQILRPDEGVQEPHGVFGGER